MAVFADGFIEAYVGPQELGAADNLEQVIIDFINEAEKTLDVAVQEIDSMPIAEALIAARWRGLNVRVFLEQAYVTQNKLPTVSVRDGETFEEARHRAQWEDVATEKNNKVNRDILRVLLRNRVDVKVDFNPKIFHQKFIIRDFRGGTNPKSAVLSGSTNFTTTGTHENLNHIVIFNHVGVCRRYRSEFDEIREGNFGVFGRRKRTYPKTVNSAGVPVRILFAPDDFPELEFVKQMLKCKQRLDFAIFTFSGSSGVDDALIMLRQANRAIRGVFDPLQGGQWWSASNWLHEHGIDVFLPDAGRFPGKFNKLHHKLLVVDEAIVVAGSMNYSAPANEFNDENIFVIGNPFDLDEDEGGPVDHAKCAEIARFFRNEIDRIIALSKPFQ
ncbi:MAG: phospholipase D-like domain-containing protein [Chloroflexota bacterium]